MKNRKHFTDISDVNYLMCQAIQYPALTPSSSLRTSHIVVFEGPMIDDMGELEKAIGLKDYMGCSSIHGVGPSIAFLMLYKMELWTVHVCIPHPCIPKSKCKH